MKYSTHFGVVLINDAHTTDVTVAIGIKCLRHFRNIPSTDFSIHTF